MLEAHGCTLCQEEKSFVSLSAGGNNIGKVTSRVHRRCRACLGRIHGPGMAAGSVGCLTASKHPASGFPVHL